MGCVPLRGGGRRGGGGGRGGGAIGPVNYNDPCSPNPCVYGTCSRVGNEFRCDCQAGYAGSRDFLVKTEKKKRNR